jgi:hypothetical protein
MRPRFQSVNLFFSGRVNIGGIRPIEFPAQSLLFADHLDIFSHLQFCSWFEYPSDTSL